MNKKRIRDLFQVKSRFLRSAHLERDFDDATGLAGYVVTDFTRSCLARVVNGLKENSGQRAWRMTGDYGSGKSSFALLLAHWFAGRDKTIPPEILKAVDFRQFGVRRPRFIPVLVTCSRQALGTSILLSLQASLTKLYGNKLYGKGNKSKVARNVQHLLDTGQEPSEDQIIKLVLETNSRIIMDSKGKGLIFILDELGKFLEFAALHPQRQDIFLLQRLAEAAARSDDQPMFVINLLHQGFNFYADSLTQAGQREWEKVAGRFEEIVFNQPIDQIANIIASALNIRTQSIPKTESLELRRATKQTLALGWFGSTSEKTILELAPSLYPLHPTILPILVRTFRRFGQNERSLFSFLLSNEPFGLQAFSERTLQNGDLYRLHNFYDYVRTNFGHRLIVQSYRSHWNLIDSVVESFATEDELQIKLLKTVGILNLIGDGDLLPTEESVTLAVAGLSHQEQKRVQNTLKILHKDRRVLYNRGRARGLCLWPHTSVDLEKAYENARRTINTPLRVASFIQDWLEATPLVARRHYIETGNLRHFDVCYCSVTNIMDLVQQNPNESDGRMVIPLCETPSERDETLSFAKNPIFKQRSNWLLAVPQPLANLGSLVQEVQRWEWIATNTPELNADKFAREEVSRQILDSRQHLDKRLQSYLGLKQQTGRMMLEWFHEGHALKIKNGRDVFALLSTICDTIYDQAPRIHNELVNRRNLSSAAAAARMRLIERMFTDAGTELLGMVPAKKPPEMSMYLSVLRNTGLHQKKEGTWRIDEPSVQTDEYCRVLPTLRRTHEILQNEPDSRVGIHLLFSELRRPPYGVRDGLLPLFLTVYILAHEKNVAFYKDGTFVRDLDGHTIRLLTKAPERFEIQYCKIEGLRAELFHQLLAVLGMKDLPQAESVLLEIVKQLCVFVARLPTYVLNTKKLSPTARAVRDAILEAREPVKLLFTDLPQACGLPPVPANASSNNKGQALVKTLKLALDDLKVAFPELQERIKNQLRVSFELPGTFQEFRTGLAARSEQILISVTEPKLRAFCLRLMDDNLPESDWLESIGSYLALKPPSKWQDQEEEIFINELHQHAEKFHRVESIVFGEGKRNKNTLGVRLAITQANGQEHEQVIYYSANEEVHLKKLQRQFEGLLGKNKRLGLAAVSRAIWSKLKEGKTTKYE